MPDATIAFVRGELDRLRQPVVILPGNHDALYSKSIYDRHDFSAGAPHVHVIRQRDGETLDFPELQVSVWGRAMEEHVPTFQPLGNIPRPDDRRWSIAMGHGFFYPEGSGRTARRRSSRRRFATRAGTTSLSATITSAPTSARAASRPATIRAPLSRGAQGDVDGALLRIDFSADDGIRVSPRRLD